VIIRDYDRFWATVCGYYHFPAGLFIGSLWDFKRSPKICSSEPRARRTGQALLYA
jgi:hypothetical protein